MFFRQRHLKLDKNVVVFTMHKAGSMVLHRVLKDVCDPHRIRYHSENQPEPDKLPVRKIFEGKDYIAKHNGCFGPIRFFLPSRALDTANILLHLRDPRDVLTSMFYSYCFMHRGPVPANTGIRKEVADAGIDKFVLDMSSDEFMRYDGDYGTGGNYKEKIGHMVARYERYLREILVRPNAILVSYEEMVLDFPSWLGKVVARFELADNDEAYRFVAAARGAETEKPLSEDVWSHKRKVTPGDHKEKLRPETIAELNRRFGGVLDALGYASGDYAASGIPQPAIHSA
ncbi:MAG: sulfotransferase domain-containing protein [Verrucomicrobiota bacterium]|nr:sulfotransferase domain-containing protein [Verrucomicrobiota bacterium]